MIKNSIKAFFLVLIFLLSVFFIINSSGAASAGEVNIYFFWAEGCPHCEKENEFFDRYEAENPQVAVQRFEVNRNRENSKLLTALGKELNIDITGVPVTIVNNKVVYGYMDDATTGAKIIDLINLCEEENCPDPAGDIIKREQENGNLTIEESDAPTTKLDIDKDNNLIEKELPENIKLPFFGEIKTENFSLPILTIIIGGLDGFNPCAMWVLLFLISLLLGMKNKKRMWILGITFILTSGISYFLFMSAWLNLFLFIGFIVWVRYIVGLIAAGSGIYHLREYWLNRKGCKTIMGSEGRKKIFDRLKAISSNQRFIVALGGIILIAFAVNLVELVCSAGLPAIYTSVLSLSDIPSWQYYMYIAFYILIFMLDDLIIFFIAMITLRAVGISRKYSRYSSLIGGIIILILGILLIFKPGWLMFG